MSAKKGTLASCGIDMSLQGGEPSTSVSQLLDQARATAKIDGLITTLGPKVKDATGSQFSDILDGNELNNTFYGRQGDDALGGRAGDDELHGDGGNDEMFGDEGNDILDGGSGNDVLDGGIGNDVLVGGSGKDVMTGGLGADRFVFAKVSESAKGAKRDVITDFNGAEGDVIDLRPLLNSLKGVSSLEFIENQAFTDKGQLRFEDGILSGNFTGNLKPDFEVELVGVTSFNAEYLLVA